MEALVTLGVDDAGEVMTLQRAAYVTEARAHHDLDLPPLTQSLDELTAELANPQTVAVGWRDASGRLLAAVRANICSDQNVADIARLAVVPDQQGKGLGTRLLAALEQRLPSHVGRLRLFTGEHSTGNLRLYARLGFTESRREQTRAGYLLVHLDKRRTIH